MAEIMKKTEPSRLIMLTHHSDASRMTHQGFLHTTMTASSVATRKQIEPTKSGVQIARFCWWGVDQMSCIASNVLRLNHNVPANCTADAVMSSAPVDWRSWQNPADVKKIEPMKNVSPATLDGTADW